MVHKLTFYKYTPFQLLLLMIFLILISSGVGLKAQNQNFLPGIIYTKIYPEYATTFDLATKRGNNINKLLDVNSVHSLIKFGQQRDALQSKEAIEMSKIFILRFDESIPVLEKVEELKQTGYFEVVEPSYTFDVMLGNYRPNDPFADPDLGSNNGMNQAIIHDFYSAWEIESGDTNVVVGIVDTGVNFDQEDSQDNLKLNFNDPIDGINNDGDVFAYDLVNEDSITDNFRGWDVADRDNDPSLGPGSRHGAEMASVIGSTHNNGIGLAGIGFNTKYIPYKAAPDANPDIVSAGYIGLLLAAMQGCKVINASWGGPMVLPQIFEDVTNWCTFRYDALIVSACGNFNNEDVFFPASFPNVFSVATLQADSTISVTSNFNYQVDLIAAGDPVRSALGDSPDTYYNIRGSSGATAVVSGLAALVRSRFPELSAIQTRRQILVTADYIDSLQTREEVIGKIGKMINPVAALTDSVSPGLRPIDFIVNDGNNTFNSTGELVALDAAIVNLLRPAANVSYTVTAITDNFSVVDNQTGTIDNISMMDTLPHLPREVSLELFSASADTTQNYVGRIDFSDENGYRDHEYFFFQMTSSNDVVTGVDSFEDGTTFSVYPNPFKSDLYIRNFDGESNQIELIDSRSNAISISVVGEAGLHRIIPTTALSPGVYFIKLNNGETKSVLRSVKID